MGFLGGVFLHADDVAGEYAVAADTAAYYRQNSKPGSRQRAGVQRQQRFLVAYRRLRRRRLRRHARGNADSDGGNAARQIPVALSALEHIAPHDDKGRKQSARLRVRAHAAPESARARELYGRRPSERDQQRPYGNQRLVRPFCAVPARFDSVDAAGDVLSGANQSAFGGNPRDYGHSHGVPRARL